MNETAQQLTQRLAHCRDEAIEAARTLEEVHELMSWDPFAEHHPDDRTLAALLARAARKLETIVELAGNPTCASFTPASPQRKAVAADEETASTGKTRHAPQCGHTQNPRAARSRAPGG